MNELQKTRIKKITELHSEIGGYIRVTIDKAIEIGGLLAEQKSETNHGEWLPWVKENLPFSERVARDYMRFYDRREELKSANVADLTEARKQLSPPPPPPPVEGDDFEALGDEWFDREMVDFYIELYKSSPMPENAETVNVKTKQIKVPDTQFQRLCANSEIMAFRHAKYEAIEERIFKKDFDIEELRQIMAELMLYADDWNHLQLHLIKHMIFQEIEKGELSFRESRTEAIRECVEHLNERNPWRVKNGYKELPTDRLVPLADSRKKKG